MTTHAGTGHGRHWLPESRVGRWAVALAGLTVASVVVIVQSIAFGVVDLAESFMDNWVFTVWGLSIWATGTARGS